MSEQSKSRELLGLTQPEAASRAGVSLATWRRWEADPDSVSQATRDKCAKVLDRESAINTVLRASDANFDRAWVDSTILTPRQASAIAGALIYWADVDIEDWLDDPTDEPLHTVGPFAQLDRRVMILVNENRAWAAKAQERCFAVAEEIEAGVLPFDRYGCYFDELVIAAALSEAKTRLSDMPDLYEGIPAMGEDEADYLSDDDWDQVGAGFDDRCRFDDFEVPLFNNHLLLAAVLADRHPYTWFDPSPSNGHGYLQQLSGLAVTYRDTDEAEAEAQGADGSANGGETPSSNGAERN